MLYSCQWLSILIRISESVWILTNYLTCWPAAIANSAGCLQCAKKKITAFFSSRPNYVPFSLIKNSPPTLGGGEKRSIRSGFTTEFIFFLNCQAPTLQSEPAFFKIKDKAPSDCNGSRFVFLLPLSRLKSLPAFVISSQTEASAPKGTATKIWLQSVHMLLGLCVWRCNLNAQHTQKNSFAFLWCSSSPWTFTQASSFGYLWWLPGLSWGQMACNPWLLKSEGEEMLLTTQGQSFPFCL